MDLSEALSDWPSDSQKKSGGGAWPGQPPAPSWPGAGGSSQPSCPVWPGAGGPQPAWPGAGGSSQPSNPMWPGPGVPSQPSGPGGFPSQPSGPGGFPCQPSGPGGFPSQPSGPGGFPSQPSGPGFPSQPTWPDSRPSHPGPAVPQKKSNGSYCYGFCDGLQDKKLITIAGTVKPNPKKFIIDLCMGKDIVFHFNPRFNECGRPVIVRNSLIGNRWGREERELSCFPFTPGRSFEIKILVTSCGYKVAVNDSHLLEYRHRCTSLKDIKVLNIHDDVILSKINVEDLH